MKIVAIDNDSGSPTYGKITFLAPLTNSYLSTWPLYLDETGTTPPPENGQYTAGGPATLYAMDPRFDHTAVINGLTIAHHPQMGVSALSLTLNSCVFESIWGPHATASRTVVFNDCLGVLCTMEVDKLITSFTMNNCDWGGLSFQSASVTEFIADNTDIRFSVSGTPRKSTFRNGSTIGTISGTGMLVPGAQYGFSNELIVTDSVVKNFGAVTTHESGMVIPGGTTGSSGVQIDFPMSGGVISVPKSFAVYQYSIMWAVTGGKVFMYDQNIGTIGAFSISNVTESGGNALVQTSLSGGWPSRTYGSTGLRLIPHSAPICTFTNVTGCPEVVDLSNAGAAGLPLYSYSKRTYNGSVAVMDYWQVWGRVKKIVVTVTQAYTGVFGGAVTLALAINVSNQFIKMSDYTTVTWAPTIDLKKTGTRTFDATAGSYPVSWSSTAVAAADALPTMTEALWAPYNFRPSMTDISSEAAGVRPIFSIEVVTDQGFVVGSGLVARSAMAGGTMINSSGTARQAFAFNTMVNL